MNTPREQPAHKAREHSFHTYVTRDLGYCCEWFFLSRYLDNNLIALRLGLASRVIREHRAKHREGKLSCTCATNCMKHILERKFDG